MLRMFCTTSIDMKRALTGLSKILEDRSVFSPNLTLPFIEPIPWLPDDDYSTVLLGFKLSLALVEKQNPGEWGRPEFPTMEETDCGFTFHVGSAGEPNVGLIVDEEGAVAHFAHYDESVIPRWLEAFGDGQIWMQDTSPSWQNVIGREYFSRREIYEPVGEMVEV